MYKVQGTSSDGETFYVDGSEHGKVFGTAAEAVAYALGYATAVGEVVALPDQAEDGFRAWKGTDYYEDIRIVPEKGEEDAQ